MKLTILSLILFLTSTAALAFDIQIDPGNYTGQYSVSEETGSLSGTQTVNLNTGTYNIITGAISSFQINIDITGVVTVTNGVSAQGGPESLSFNTSPVDIKPGSYNGDWSLPSVTSTLNGPKNSIFLVKGLSFLIQVAAIDSFIFSLNSSGEVSSISKPAAATNIGNIITFTTTPINIDPNLYLGSWSLPNVNTLMTGALSNINLIPGLKYLVQLDTTGSFNIELDELGKITVTNGISAIANNNNLIFNSFGIDVDPGSYTGHWFFSNVTSPTSGVDTNIHLVPGVTFRLDIQNGEVAQIDIQSPCALEPSSVNFTFGNFTLSCHQTSSPFLCEKKIDYDSSTTCSGNFVADNQSELDIYLSDYGLFNNQYKNLKINFDLIGSNVMIHSPCKIKIQANSNIQVDNLCLDGRNGVNIRSESIINAQDIVILSEKGNAEVNNQATINASNLAMEGFLQTRIRPNSNIKLTGDLFLNSTGNDPLKSRAVIRPYSQVSANSIKLNSSVISVIRHDSIISTGFLEITGSKDVRIGNRTNVTASDIHMVGQQEFSIGKNANIHITNHFERSGQICNVKNSAQITAGSESGSCSPF